MLGIGGNAADLERLASAGEGVFAAHSADDRDLEAMLSVRAIPLALAEALEETGSKPRAAERLGVPHAQCIAKARVGIYVAIRALIQPGQKVVLSPYTISDVINMSVCAGGVPVFADLDPDTCNVSADEIDRLVDSDTGEPVRARVQRTG